MISSETQFNKYGWKLKVIKSKDTTTIMQRSKHGIHKYSKPMTLRLQNEDIKELIEMLKETNNLLNDANSGVRG